MYGSMVVVVIRPLLFYFERGVPAFFWRFLPDLTPEPQDAGDTPSPTEEYTH